MAEIDTKYNNIAVNNNAAEPEQKSEPEDLVFGQGMSEALFNAPQQQNISDNTAVPPNPVLPQRAVTVEQKEYEDLGFRFETQAEPEYVYNRGLDELNLGGTLLGADADPDRNKFLTGYMRQYDDFNLAAETARGKLGAALAITQGVDPEKEARLNRLGEMLQLPREVVKNNPQLVNEIAAYRDDFEYLQSVVSPEALEWFADPENFAQAKGDMALKKLDAIYTSYNSNMFGRAWYDLKTGVTSAKQAMLGTHLSLIEGGRELFRKTLGGLHKYMTDARVDHPEYFSAADNDNELSYLQKALENKSDAELKAFARKQIVQVEVPDALREVMQSKSLEETVADVRKGIAELNIPEEERQRFDSVKGEVEKTVREQLYRKNVETPEQKKERLLQEFYRTPVSDEIKRDLQKAENTPIPLLDAGWLDDMVGMTPLMAAGIASGVFTGGVSAALLFGQQAQGSSYLELVDSGVDPEIALLGSGAIGTAEGALEYLTFKSFGRLAKAFGLGGTNKIGVFDAAYNIGKEQLKEFSQEYAQSISSEGQKAIYKYLFADGYELRDAVQDFADKGIVGGSKEGLMVLPFGILGSGAYLVNYAGRAKASKQAFGEYLEQLDAAGQSKLRENNPDKFADFLRNIMGGADKRRKREVEREERKSTVVSEDNPEKVVADLKQQAETEVDDSESYNQSFYLKADRAQEILEDFYKDPVKVTEFLDKIGVDSDCFDVCAQSKAYIAVDAVNWTTHAARTKEEELLRNHLRFDQNIASMDEIYTEGKEAEKIREQIEQESKRLREIKTNFDKVMRSHRSRLLRKGFDAKSVDNILTLGRKMMSTLAQQEGKDISDVASRLRFESDGKVYYRPKLERKAVAADSEVVEETAAQSEELTSQLIGRADGLGENTFKTVAGALDTEDPVSYFQYNQEAIINSLVADKVIDKDEVPVFVDQVTGKVNTEHLIDLLVGSFIPDAKTLQRLPGNFKAKLGLVASQIIQSGNAEGWDLRPFLYGAAKERFKQLGFLNAHNSAYMTDKSDISHKSQKWWDKYLKEQGGDTSIAKLAKWLDTKSFAELRSDLSRYLLQIPDAEQLQNQTFGEVMPDRSEVLSKILGTEIKLENETYKQAKRNENNDQRYQRELVDTVFKNKRSDHVINVLQTPQVLKALGVKDLPITITARVINKVKNNKHKVSYKTLADLPNQLREPLMVIKSQSQNNSIVVFTEHVDENGLPVIIALHLDVQETRHNVNKIASVYGLSNFESKVHEWINKGDLLYIDNEKSSDLLQSRGLQLPKEGENQSNSDNSESLRSRGLRLPKEGENQSKDNNSDLLQSRGLQLPKEGENRSYKIRSDIFNIPEESENVNKNIEDEFDTLQQQTRGNIVFDGVNAVINLMETANASTVLHEMMHWYSVNARTIIENGMGSEEFRRDYQTLLKYGELTEEETGTLGTSETGKKYGYTADGWEKFSDADRQRIFREEKIAEAFEQYVMEGKAPAPALMRVFEQLKKMLKDIYRFVRFDHELTPEVQDVFDRIFATDDELEEMRRFHREYEDQAGMVLESEEALQQFFNMTNKQRDRETVYATRAYFKFMKAKGVEEIYRQAKREVEAEPAYKALLQIRDAGGISEDTFKLLTGEGSASFFGQNNHKLVTKTGGADINAFALENGFESGEALLQDLRERVEINRAIAIRQQELRGEYQEEFAKLEAGRLETENNPFYNDDELEKLAYLYNAISEEINRTNKQEPGRGLSDHEISVKAIKEHVKTEFDKYKGRNLTSIQAFMTADEQAGKELRRAMKAGEKERTMELARVKMYTHARLQQAVRGNELVRRFDQRYKTRNMQNVLKNVEDDFREVIKDIVITYKLSNSGLLRPRVDSEVLLLPEFNVGAEGFETENLGEAFGLGEYFSDSGSGIIPEWLYNKDVPEGYRNFKDLSIAQIRELSTAVEFLIKQGRNDLRALKTDKLETIKEYVTELAGTMEQLGNKKMSSIEDGKIRHKFQSFIDNINSRDKMIEYLCDEIDNFAFMNTSEPGLMGKTFAQLVQCEVEIKELQEELFKELEPHLDILVQARKRWEEENGGKFGEIEGFPLPEIFSEKSTGRTRLDFDMLLGGVFNLGNDANEWAFIQGYRLGQKEFEEWCRDYSLKYLDDITANVDSLKREAQNLEKQAAHYDETGNHGQAFEARKQSRDCLQEVQRLEERSEFFNELKNKDMEQFIQRVGMQELEYFREMRLKFGREYTGRLAEFFTDKEWDAIQGVWDTINVLYDPLAEVTYSLHNIKPRKEEAVPFMVKTADGKSKSIRGGYFPLVYDPKLNDRTAAQNAHNDAMKGMKSNSKSVQVTAGSKNERNRGDWFSEAVVERPPLLSAQSVLLRHITETTRYIKLAETLTDFDMITRDSLFKDVFVKKFGHEMYDKLRKFVEDLANPDKDIPKGFDELLDKTRKLNCIWTLGLNIGTGVKQRLSAFNAVYALSNHIGRNKALHYYYEGVKYCGKDNVTLGLKNQNIEKLLQKSEYLRARQGEFDINVRDMLKEFNPLGDRKTFNIGGKEVGLKEFQDWMFKWIQMNDQATIFTVWKGAYEAAFQEELGGVAKSKNPIENERLAVLFADKILRTTQPSTLNTDLSELQRNKQGLLHFFAVFKTFTLKATNIFSHHYNAYKAGKISGSELSEMFIMNFVLPRWSVLIAEGMIGNVLLGGDDDKNKFWEFGVMPFADTVAGVPLLSDALSSILSGYDVKVGAVDKFKLVERPIRHTFKGDYSTAVWDFAKLFGFSAGVPVKNIYKNGKFVSDMIGNNAGK